MSEFEETASGMSLEKMASELRGRLVDFGNGGLPTRVSCPEDVKAHLEDLGEDAAFYDGKVLVSEWGSAEFHDEFLPPEALENPTFFRLRRAVRVGRRVIRSTRVTQVLEFSHLSGVRANGYAAIVPLGTGYGTTDPFDSGPTELRYYVGVESPDPRLEVASRAIYEVAANIDGASQRHQLAIDEEAHEKWIEANHHLFGDEARQRSIESDREMFASMRVFQKETGLEPLDPNNVLEFIQWNRAQEEAR